jgi:ligand-binding sensor domain-containing protein/signal transduction histidine kinase
MSPCNRVRPAVTSFLVACLVLAGFASSALASSAWIPHVWQSDEGLPDNTVTGIAQSSDGYLWVATTGGFARFDGERFQDFPLTRLAQVPAEMARRVLLDHLNRLWVVMERGTIVCIASNSATVFPATISTPDARVSGFSETRVNTMAEDRDGAIWVSYSRGDLTRIKNGERSELGVKEGLPPGDCWITADAAGELWFAIDKTVGVFRAGKFITLATVREHATQIQGSRAGGVWIGGNAKVFKYTEGGSLEDRARLPKGSHISALLEDHSGALWVGTLGSGLYRADDHGVTKAHLTPRQIACITEDHEGNIWTGIMGGGLIRLRSRTAESFDAESGLPFLSARSVTIDTAGQFWVATPEGEVYHGGETNWQTVSEIPGWPGFKALSVVADKTGGVWIGTRRGLVRYAEGQFEVFTRKKNQLLGDGTRALFISSKGDLWLGSDNPRGIQCVHSNEWKTFMVPPETTMLRAITEDAQGNIWAGSANGYLFRVDGDQLVNETARVQGWTNSIRALHATSDGSLWIGYFGRGLGRWKNNKFTSFSTAEGLWNEAISQISSDSAGRLWLASNHGLFRVNIREFDDLAAGRTAALHPVVYAQAEGLNSLQAAFEGCPATWQTAEGEIWMAMASGLVLIHPASAHDNPVLPPIILEQISVDGKTVAIHNPKFPLVETNEAGLLDLAVAGQMLHLPPDHRKVQFDFTALSFSAPENVRFRYRLEGFDHDWVQGGTQRHATYTKLAAGDYRFRVMACNDSGRWNETGATVNLVVLPFFWQTRWFQAAVILGFAGVIFAFARFVAARRMRLNLQRMEHQQALENSRVAGMAEVATSVLHNVGNVVNSVNVSNSVIRDKIKASKVSLLKRIAGLLNEHAADLPRFLAEDPKGKQLPKVLSDLGDHLVNEQQAILEELSGLGNNIEHIKNIVSRQQSYARVSGGTEPLEVAQLVEDALQINAASISRSGVEIIREFGKVPKVNTDKHKVLQILINLVSNAKYALANSETPQKRLTVTVGEAGAGRVKITVRDNGLGIAPENLAKIFQHGFTTKKTGHGFGLHGSVRTAEELGGSLTASSDGPGKGAAFILELPTQPGGKNAGS